VLTKETLDLHLGCIQGGWFWSKTLGRTFNLRGSKLARPFMVFSKCLSAWLLLALSLPLSGDAWAFSLSPLAAPPLHHRAGSSSTRWRHGRAAPHLTSLQHRSGRMLPADFRYGATHMCSHAGLDDFEGAGLVAGGGAPGDTQLAGPWRIDVVYEDEDVLVVNKPSGLGFHTEVLLPSLSNQPAQKELTRSLLFTNSCMGRQLFRVAVPCSIRAWDGNYSELGSRESLHSQPTLEVTQGKILSQSPTDATFSRLHLYGS